MGDRQRPNPARALCVSLHDVAPATWPLCARLLTELDALGRIPITLLVVPWYHRGRRIEDDTSFRRAIDRRLALGDELALHGYTHLDESPPARHPLEHLVRRHYTAGEGEFHALTTDQACTRLHAGLEAFARMGWTAPGFVAPAWLMGAAARRALETFNFRYTTTLKDFIALPSGKQERSRSLVYSVRKPWRMQASLAWNRLLFQRSVTQPLLRLSLHPADAACAPVLNQAHELIIKALGDRRALTKSAWLEASPSIAQQCIAR